MTIAYRLTSMDVLWFNWRDIKNPEAGGAEIYTHEIAKRLAEKGHSVTVFTSEFKGCRVSDYKVSPDECKSFGYFNEFSKSIDYNPMQVHR